MPWYRAVHLKALGYDNISAFTVLAPVVKYSQVFGKKEYVLKTENVIVDNFWGYTPRVLCILCDSVVIFFAASPRQVNNI